MTKRFKYKKTSNPDVYTLLYTFDHFGQAYHVIALDDGHPSTVSDRWFSSFMEELPPEIKRGDKYTTWSGDKTTILGEVKDLGGETQWAVQFSDKSVGVFNLEDIQQWTEGWE